ncbi:MaoC/PaaZ C-terminal domain-containing protein [Actinopolymorpha singaporensis]|uniref:Acyl dehydratase n=1 Tax=Actinopolymorpha singaporensis TaxID=117157 RepID=A0A1H1S9W7_9ACTN|nr:MaoC family dehydratase [Actinopolymorpha singaporensis]SDS44099.1 Acyl dehydratase [Actinopolymorpha singaporensis]
MNAERPQTGEPRALGGVPAYDEVEKGTELPSVTIRVRREDLVRYAGASGDFNRIHWNARVAREVGLPDVIAHGMLTMGAGARVLTEWAVDPARVVEYSVRFTRPVTVPDDDEGVAVTFGGKVADKLPDRVVRVDLTAVAGGEKVFGAARAMVRLD